jgi:hypothetical protein
MARKLSATEIFETVEVDLWGAAYTMRQITRSSAQRLDDAQAKAADIDETSTDRAAAAAALIELVDILLEPAAGTKPATEVLTALWESDELGFDWLTAFVEALQEEAAARRRPTSAPAKRA